MTATVRRMCAAAAVLAAVFPVTAHAAGQVQVMDLGTGTATAMNDLGVVVGIDLNAQHTGWVWNAGTRTPLTGNGPDPGGISNGATAADINASGRIVGTLLVSGAQHATYWDMPAAPVDVGLFSNAPNDGSAFTSGNGVSTVAEIAGYGNVEVSPATVERGFIASGGGGPQAVGEADKPPSAPSGANYSTFVYTANASGAMFGQVTQNGGPKNYIWPNSSAHGTQVDLLVTRGGASAPPYGRPTSHQLADDGALVGRQLVGNQVGQAYLRPSGGTDTLMGDFDPISVNNSHTVVGYKLTGSDYQAVMWKDGQLTVLDDLLPPSSGWQLEMATDINGEGDIVGVGLLNGVAHGFVVRGGIVVNDGGDDPDAAPSDGLCRTAGNVCTLRAAIQEANSQPGEQTIQFAVPGGASGTINVAATLPNLTGPVVVRGETQAGGVARIVGNGGNFAGLTLDGSGGKLSGLVVGGFGGDGIVLAGGGGHTITRSFIGTDPSSCGDRTGPACPLGNGGAGVRALSGDNVIGLDERPNVRGGKVTDFNFIANNKGPGIAVMAGQHTGAVGNYN